LTTRIDAAEPLNNSFIRQNLPWRVDDVIKSQSSRWLAAGVGEIKFKETTAQPRQPQVVITQLLKNFRPQENP